MIIPSDAGPRLQLYQDVLAACTASRQHRRDYYKALKMFYLFGANGTLDDPNARFNKILPHLDQLKSFMYSQETTRFDIELGESVNDAEKKKTPTISRQLQKEWNNSNAGNVAGHCVRWSFVYGSMFSKQRWKKKHVETFAVEPHNFGVYREDVTELSRQEAVSHTYYITKSQLRAELISGGRAKHEEILEQAQASSHDDSFSTVGPVDRVIISAVSPEIQGNVDMWSQDFSALYRPRVTEPLIEMNELYIYNDEIGDFQVVTMMDPSVVIWDRPNERIFLKDELPFVQFCPIPAYDYFYGYAEVERLIPLQLMRNERMQDVRHMMKLQAHPPKSATGFMGDQAEIAETLDSPSGLVITDTPNAKMDVHQPTIPQDLFREIREIDDQFGDTSGISAINEGKGEQGVRSAGHAAQLSKLGASRAKDRAMVIQDSLEKQATLYVQVMRRYDDRQYREESTDGRPGNQFLLSQFTENFVAKVDSHSSSPIFTEEAQGLAFDLFKVKAIDREDLLDLVPVPKRELLQQKLKNKIEPQEAAAAAEERKLKLATVQGKAGVR